MLGGCTPFPVFDKSSMTGVKCTDDILVRYVRVCRDAVDPDRSHIVNEFLKIENIHLMYWRDGLRFKPNLASIGRCEELNWDTLPITQNQPEARTSIYRGVRVDALRTNKLHDFQHIFTL